MTVYQIRQNLPKQRPFFTSIFKSHKKNAFAKEKRSWCTFVVAASIHLHDGFADTLMFLSDGDGSIGGPVLCRVPLNDSKRDALVYAYETNLAKMLYCHLLI